MYKKASKNFTLKVGTRSNKNEDCHGVWPKFKFFVFVEGTREGISTYYLTGKCHFTINSEEFLGP